LFKEEDIVATVYSVQKRLGRKSVYPGIWSGWPVGYRHPVPSGTDDVSSPALTCVTPDNVELAVYDFGGTGDDLLLVHATGFCAGVLLPLARALSSRFRCHAFDLRGHGRSGRPVDGNYAWSGFATDVLTVVDRLGLERSVGFGHSCGGASLLMAEQARPGTFRGLYLFEPVVVPVQPMPVPVEENPLSTGARRRRETFPSAEDAFVNFSSKPPFEGLDPEVLKRYVEDGFEVTPAAEGGDGHEVRLRCRRDDEAEVYRHGFANGAFARLDEVQCPATFAYGEDTDAFGEHIMSTDAACMNRATVVAYRALTHFGPLERPEDVAKGVLGALEATDDTTPA
jgi:pimeloyl-ACP methyl ester carboxylesterase